MSTLKGISESRLLNTSQFAYLNWELLTYFIKKSDFVSALAPLISMSKPCSLEDYALFPKTKSEIKSMFICHI